MEELEDHFIIGVHNSLIKLKITKYHVFQFNSDFPGSLRTQELTTAGFTGFSLLRTGFSFIEAHEIALQLVN